MSIEVRNLVKIYGDQRAVDGVSFELKPGEIVGFLGPNGAGKSTTMKIISGYLAPDEGTAVVCGIDVKAEPLQTKTKIGYLPEANPLYFDMYVREYLDFVADIHEIADKRKRIQEVIEMVGLTPESKKRIGELSKGYKQRVGLAAALIHDPEVLILDEPTTGLDPNQIVEIRDVIRNLGKNKTVLFSSHILQEVEAICDRVVIINKGKIVADDTLSKLQKGAAGNQLVTVEFKESVEESSFNAFVDIIRMHKVDQRAYKFETNDPDSVRRQILQLSLQRNLNIVSLQSGEQRLEQIFRDLTGNKQ